MRVIETAVIGGILALMSGNALGNPQQKNGDDPVPCVEDLGDGEYRLSLPDEASVSCFLVEPTYGVHVRLDWGEMIVKRGIGVIKRGAVRVLTAGAPFLILGDQVHRIAPNNIVDVVVEGDLTYIESKDGCTDVTSCYEASTGHNESYFLEEGDLLVLYRNGVLYAWEDVNMESRIQSGGCSLTQSANAGAKAPEGILGFLLLVIWLWLRRHTRKREVS